MRTKRTLILSLVLLLALAGGGLWWWRARPASASSVPPLELTGVIEARRVPLAPEVGGRIETLLVEEGQQVTSGEVLAQIDTALLEAQLEQARAAVGVAQANLAQIKAGARAEEIAAAQAAVEQARAARDGAARAYENTLKILKNPQELEAQLVQVQAARDSAQRMLDQVRAGSRPEDIAAAEAGVAQAQAGVQTTRDQLSAAKTRAENAVEQAANALRLAQQNYSTAQWQYQYVLDTGIDPVQQKVQDPTTGKVIDNKLNDFQKQLYKDRLDAAAVALHNAEQALQQAQVAAESARQAEITGIQAAEAQAQTTAATLAKLRNGPRKTDLAVAQTALANAQRALDVARRIRDNPQQLQAAADAAQAQLAAAEAQLAQAQAQLDAIQAGARSEQIGVAEAQVAQARAAQHQIEVQIAKATIRAPQNGLVLSRSAEPGQTAAPGATLLEIARLDRLELTVYLPEGRFGSVTPGQAATIRADAYPGRTFAGTVLRLADQAEFTPTNVQTKEDRSRLVYAAVVGLDNPDLALKPGMFAEVTFP